MKPTFVPSFASSGGALLFGMPLLVMAVTSCGSQAANLGKQAELCSAIATEYSAALTDAQICEPGVATSCAAQRPFPRYEDGTVVDLWACPPGSWDAAVNPDRTASLDALLTRYTSQGCEIRYGLPCPGPGGPRSPPPPCQANGVCR